MYAESCAPAIRPLLMTPGHGTRAAHIASRIIEHYLKVTLKQTINTEGDE